MAAIQRPPTTGLSPSRSQQPVYAMIYEERDYRIKFGKLSEFLQLYGDHGLPIQKEHLGNLVAYFTSEIGELNHIVAIWSYESFEDRAARRKNMLADQRWHEYLKCVDGFIDVQATRILSPVSFSPLQ
ncbi:NIPSNAP family protein [Bosea sp. NBC_00550]|uniref:NIPSNAP family protein n=1 Tax=Bosea sp. NBC_00550 TaxID=2969621 RepID=UPI002230E8C8|nr:NIPSNAP family protein [Bosea sp. NBC_00550]UZF90607.1 NIPSNAP family protein [Bosea sp. NBC_00550]